MKLYDVMTIVYVILALSALCHALREPTPRTVHHHHHHIEEKENATEER